MKILMVFLTASGLAPISGGVEHFIQFSKFLIKDGNEVHILTDRAGKDFLKKRHVNGRFHVIRIPFDNSLHQSSLGVATSYLSRLVTALFHLRSLSMRYDVVCAVSLYLPDIVLSHIIWRLYKPRISPVVFVHGPLIHSPIRRLKYHSRISSVLAWISQCFSLYILERLNWHIFATPLAEKQLSSLIETKTKMIDIVNNGIDLGLIRSISPKENGYDACFLGGMLVKKGVFDLLYIWQLVCKEMPKAKLAMVGAGHEKYAVEKKIKGGMLKDNISVLGYLSEEEKLATLKASKIFLYPSYEESWGIAVCEAMACGLPVVAYDLPAYRVFKDAVIRVPERNIKAFAHVVLDLLSDEKFRRALGEKAKTIASRFDWSKITKEEMILLQNLTKAQ